ncbi:MAG: HD domain-containing protein [Syntrophaceae bacterium]|nr:HD domain-containing protein [Syntrophaceae bacterium]
MGLKKNESAGVRPALTARFRDALGFAAVLHADQVRKGSDIPYVAHLLAVASTVIEQGGNEDLAIAALLHDAAEDQGGADILARIRSLYGETVAAVVEACSDAMESPKPPWRERKECYIGHLAEAPEDVLLVSLADKLHNARAILRDYRDVGEALWERFRGGRAGTLWYYETLAETFERCGKFRGLAGELRSVVDELVRTAGTAAS